MQQTTRFDPQLSDLFGAAHQGSEHNRYAHHSLYRRDAVTRPIGPRVSREVAKTGSR
jgi:hypothetical protein